MKLERGVFPTAWTGSNNDTKGYSGAKPYFRKFSEIKGKEIKVYQGVNDEEWYTIVYDDINHTGWYTPKYTHTTTKDEVLTDAAKWLMSSMNFVATSVFFAQMAYVENLGVRNVLLSDSHGIQGGMCASNDNGAGGTLCLGDVRFWLGGSNPTTAPARIKRNGDVYFNSGTFEGVIKAKRFAYNTSDIIKTSDSPYTIDPALGVSNFLVNYGVTMVLPSIDNNNELEGMQIVISVNSYSDIETVVIRTVIDLVKIYYNGIGYSSLKLGNGSVVLCIISGSWRVISVASSRLVGES